AKWSKVTVSCLSQQELARIRDTNRSFLVVREVAVYAAAQTQQDQEEPQSDTIIHTTNSLTYSGGTVSYSEHATNKHVNQ
ncbi:MAG: hypothetical protein KDE58_36710, partial [Caldilineaceae bacterium]|nr:hypothetical protein [Caldilineaceae bacterium]